MNKEKHQLGFKDLLKLSLRVFQTQKTRSLLTILGMSISIGTIVFLLSLGYGLQYILIGKMLVSEDSLMSVEAFYPSEAEMFIEDKLLKKIESLPQTDEISSVTETEGEILFGSLNGYSLIRIVKSNYFRLANVGVDFGKVFGDNEKAVVLSSQSLKLLNLPTDQSSLNKKISLRINLQTNKGETKIVNLPEEFFIKGIIKDDESPPYVIFPKEFLIEPIGYYSRVFVKVKNIDEIENLKNSLINLGLITSTKLDFINQAKKIMNILTIILGVFGVSSLVVASIGMFNVMIIGFLERIFEIGIMKSIGASQRDILKIFLLESLILGLSGGVGGVVLGIAGGEIINFLLNLLAKNLGGVSFRLFIYPYKMVLLIVFISAFVGLISGFWPARKASLLSPKEAFIRK